MLQPWNWGPASARLWRRTLWRSWSSCCRRPYERRRLDWWRLLTCSSSPGVGRGSSSGGESLGCPQAGAPSARICGDLRRARRQGRPGHHSEPRVAPTDADRELRRTDAAAALRGDEPLDDPILERVVAEDDEPAARPQEV